MRPHASLSPFVRDVMFVEVSRATRRLRMPETGLVLAVRYRGAASLDTPGGEERVPDVALTGIAVRARTMCTEAGSGVALVRFRPGSAARFFATPLHELFGATVALTELAPRDAVDRLRERVAEARDDTARARALEAFLSERRCRPHDPLVAAAVEQLAAPEPARSVRALAAELGTSLDALEKRFRRTVGCSPKQFASMERLERALRDCRAGKSLAHAALDAGYYDQAHLHRALRDVTGIAPRAFLRSGAGTTLDADRAPTLAASRTPPGFDRC